VIRRSSRSGAKWDGGHWPSGSNAPSLPGNRFNAIGKRLRSSGLRHSPDQPAASARSDQNPLASDALAQVPVASKKSILPSSSAAFAASNRNASSSTSAISSRIPAWWRR
jgi:hypothetical protein